MIKDGVVKSTCPMCNGCGVLVHLREGKITKIEGDPDAPLTRGALCPKGLASLELLIPLIFRILASMLGIDTTS